MVVVDVVVVNNPCLFIEINEILVSIEKQPFVKIDYLQRFLQTNKKCILELNEKYHRQKRRGRPV